jgi:hypothetical protein
LAEWQQTVNNLCQEEQRQDPLFQQPHKQANFPHQPQPQMTVPLTHKVQEQPSLTYGAIDMKSLLADNLQLASQPSQYRAVTPLKYHGDTDPRKFLMCYEVALASSGGDDATLAKSLIISLEGATAN